MQGPPDARANLAVMRTVLLLTASNVFMTAAWYGHLRFREVALWKVILVSWLIAFFEYCLQVPANRLQNQRNEIDILRRRIGASVLLVKALGGGWSVAELPAP